MNSWATQQPGNPFASQQGMGSFANQQPSMGGSFMTQQPSMGGSFMTQPAMGGSMGGSMGGNFMTQQPSMGGGMGGWGQTQPAMGGWGQTQPAMGGSFMTQPAGMGSWGGQQPWGQQPGQMGHSGGNYGSLPPSSGAHLGGAMLQPVNTAAMMTGGAPEDKYAAEMAKMDVQLRSLRARGASSERMRREALSECNMIMQRIKALGTVDANAAMRKCDQRGISEYRRTQMETEYKALKESKKKICCCF